MSGDFSGKDSRVPPPFEGIQVNFCKNVECGHFGKPASPDKQPRGPGARERPNDGYILASKDGYREFRDLADVKRAAALLGQLRG